MDPNQSVEGPVDASLSGIEEVRSHRDVLALIEEVEQQLVRLRTAQTQSSRDFAEREMRLQAIELRESAVAEAERSLAQREAQVREIVEGVERDRAGVAHERERLTAAGLELERLRDEHAVQESVAAAEAERLRIELEALRQEQRAAEMRFRDVEERLADAESSLRSRDDAYERRERENERQREELGAANREREELRRSLAVAGEKLSRLAQTVAQHAPQLERGAGALARVDEQDRSIASLREKIAGLERDLEAARTEASSGAAAKDQNIRTLERALAEAKASGEADRAAIARLEGDIASLRSTLESGSQERSASETELAATRSKLAEFGVFLRERKARLARARGLLRERDRWTRAKSRESNEAAYVRTLEEERMLARQREELRQVQEMIAASEQRLLKREHRGRSVFAVGWLMLVTAALMAGSWYAADLVAPARAVAAVDLTAKTRDGAAITPDVDALFQTTYREALADEGFRTAVRRRLEERGLYALAEEKHFAEWIGGIRADSDGLGALRLIAVGPDETTAVLGLDTVATSLANEASRLARGRSDVPRIGLVGQTNVPGRLTFSAAIPQVDLERRLSAAALLFSGTVVLGIIFGALVLGRIARSKRHYEELEPA